MRVVVLGAGSAGSRHARNLAALGVEIAIADPDERKAREVARGIDGAEVVVDLDRAGAVDGVVVASPTALHAQQASAALASDAVGILVEKPLATSRAEAEELARHDHGRITVGYNLRLHPPVQRLHQLVTDGDLGTVREMHVWFGWWLPDWRPGTDYRTTYSARAELGGGVLWDASHELDLLHWVLGNGWTVTDASLGQSGALGIDVEDVVDARLRGAGGAVASVHLDYLSRTYQRGVELVGSNGSARLDWSTGTLCTELDGDHREEPASTPVDGSYVAEARRFVAQCRGEEAPLVSARDGAATVGLCEAIRSAARGSRG